MPFWRDSVKDRQPGVWLVCQNLPGPPFLPCFLLLLFFLLLPPFDYKKNWGKCVDMEIITLSKEIQTRKTNPACSLSHLDPSFNVYACMLAALSHGTRKKWGP